MIDINLAENLEKFTSNWVQATREPFANHWLANFLRNDVKVAIETIVKSFDATYQIKASAGAGNWANVPWLSILNPKITTTTQDGIYPVYLFSADGSGFYLSLMQGTTTPKRELGKNDADIRSNLIKEYIPAKFPELKSWGKQQIDLNADTALGKSYESANIVAKHYSLDSALDSETLKQDLLALLSFYQQMEALDIDMELQQFTVTKPVEIAKTYEKAEVYEKNDEPLLNKSTTLSKPFLLLAGISGTGKTRFVREQAKASGAISENYCLTPVRPDWHEPSDILGYISRLSGAAEYVTTEVLQFIAKAWRAIIDADIKLTVNEDSRLKVTGDRSQLDAVLPYWLCLDEMNLAPVEQYFADYLSVLETREWQWQADEFYYSCDALLSAATIQQLAAETKLKLRADLGFSADNYDEAWQLFCSHGLTIPFNLIVAGTVNMDETTHGFSRKVIDRALSFDFGEFFPNDFEHFFSPAVSNHTLSYPIYAQATIDTLPAMDKDGQRSIQFLQAVNAVLDDTPFKLAFRALNELLLAVISTDPKDDLQLQAVWDDFLMCKVLPRIEGDHDKLAVVKHSLSHLVNRPISTATNGNDPSLLQQLSAVLTTQLASIWDEPVGSVKARPDLYRKSSDGSPLPIACRSKAKLAWMQQRLSRSGFTSFWP